MNKYLEKIASFEKQALNAQAAREMAKKVGVIADPTSNWKYALRNLRDSRGNPLVGQPRREALNRLAGGRDIVREHQQMAAAQRKLREVDEVQQINLGRKDLTGRTPILGQANLDEVNKARDPLSGVGASGFEEKFKPNYTPTNSNRMSISHVHPPLSETQPKIALRSRGYLAQAKAMSDSGYDSRLVADDFSSRFNSARRRISGAMPSDTDTQQTAFRHLGKKSRVGLTAGDPHALEVKKAVELRDKNMYLQGMSKYEDRTRALPYNQQAARILPESRGDSHIFGAAYPNQVNPIHYPTGHVVGLHKATTASSTDPVVIGRRSVYLDMTPRSVR